MEEFPFIIFFLNPEIFMSIILILQKYRDFFGKANIFLLLFRLESAYCWLVRVSLLITYGGS